MAEAINPDCIFCKIVKKEIGANIVAETENALAFHDVHPASPLHLLIIPKVHFDGMNELSSDTAPILADMMLLAKDLAKQFAVDRSGFRLVINTGKNGGQSVFHLHLHLLGERPFSWPPG